LVRRKISRSEFSELNFTGGRIVDISTKKEEAPTTKNIVRTLGQKRIL
jgi:hypothetical protein